MYLDKYNKYKQKYRLLKKLLGGSSSKPWFIEIPSNRKLIGHPKIDWHPPLEYYKIQTYFQDSYQFRDVDRVHDIIFNIINSQDQNVNNNINNIKILSYNISWASQLNVVKGSEARFVKRCQKKKIKCYNNLIKNLPDIGQLHIAGFQEVVDETLHSKIPNISNPSYFYGKVKNIETNTIITLLTVWDSAKIGDMVFATCFNSNVSSIH